MIGAGRLNLNTAWLSVRFVSGHAHMGLASTCGIADYRDATAWNEKEITIGTVCLDSAQHNEVSGEERCPRLRT